MTNCISSLGNSVCYTDDSLYSTFTHGDNGVANSLYSITGDSSDGLRYIILCLYNSNGSFDDCMHASIDYCFSNFRDTIGDVISSVDCCVECILGSITNIVKDVLSLSKCKLCSKQSC